MFGEVGIHLSPVSSHTIGRVQPRIEMMVKWHGLARYFALIHSASSPGVRP